MPVMPQWNWLLWFVSWEGKTGKARSHLVEGFLGAAVLWPCGSPWVQSLATRLYTCPYCSAPTVSLVLWLERLSTATTLRSEKARLRACSAGEHRSQSPAGAEERPWSGTSHPHWKCENVVNFLHEHHQEVLISHYILPFFPTLYWVSLLTYLLSSFSSYTSWNALIISTSHLHFTTDPQNSSFCHWNCRY